MGIFLDLDVGKTVLHIGMPRAASTYFQNHVFPRVEGFRAYSVETTQYHPVFQKILYQDESIFDLDQTRAELQTMIESNAILSNELFVGQTLYLGSTNRTRTAQRLHALFPDAEILLVMRNQVNLLEALYSIGVYGGNTLSPESFISFNGQEGRTRPMYPTFQSKESTVSYYYSSIINTYKALFGDVKVMLFEDFQRDSEGFIDAMCSHFGWKLGGDEVKRKINPTLSERKLSMIRGWNKWKPAFESTRVGKSAFRRIIHWIEHRGGGNKRFSFDEALRNEIFEHFKADNQKLLAIKPDLMESENFQKYYIGD